MEQRLPKGQWLLKKTLRHGIVGQVKYFGLYAGIDRKPLRGSHCVGEGSKYIVKESVA